MINLDKTLDWIAELLTAVLIASFLRFQGSNNGGKIYIILSVAIFILEIRGSITLKFEPFYFFFIIFTLYVFASSLWAWNPIVTDETANHMMRSFLYFAILYIVYSNYSTTEQLMRCFKWAGYLEALYQIYYYGINGLLTLLSTAQRAENGATGNVNGIGMAIAFGCVYEMIEIAKKRKLTVSSLLLIPSFFVIAATQSKKAFLIIGIALFLVICFYYTDWKNLKKALWSLAAFGMLVILVINGMKYSTFFRGMYNRMESIINVIEGEKMDASLLGRQQLIQMGWNQFLKTPLLGIGMNNGRELLLLETNGHAYGYLHNNFIEILCGGGIIGFIIYYSRYIYIYYCLFKHIQNKNEDYYPCFIMLTIQLIMDYGLVSFYDRPSQVFFIILFLQAANINKSSKNDRIISDYRVPMSRYSYIK